MNKLKIPKKYIGIPFVENGKDFTGADCIHLAQLFVENELGIRVTRMPLDIKEAQKNNQKYLSLLEAVPLGELIPGDIPFFAFADGHWHCGIYVGYGQLLHTVQPILEHKKTASMITPILPRWHEYYIGVIRTKGKTEIIVPDAGWAVVAIVISIITTIYSVVTALTAPKPNFGNDTNSPKYGIDALDNTISNELIYPLIFGSNKYAGNWIWERTDGDITYRIVVIAIGKIHSISDVRLNDIPIGDLSGCSYTAYLGTPDQTIDARANGEVNGLRNVAYLAVTIKPSEKLNGRVTLTYRAEGFEMKTWNGSIWTGQNYSRNPAAALRHLLILLREDGGGGVDESEIDDASFGEVYDHCAELIDDGDGGTHGRHQFDYVFDAEKPIQDAIKEILQPYGMYLGSGEKISLKIMKQDDAVYDFTMDNIDNESFEHWEIDINESYNEVIVKYSDPDQNDVLIDAPARNQADQIQNGLRRSPDFYFPGINRYAEASRRAEFIKNDSCVNTKMCSFNVDIDAIHISVGSVVTVTHDEPGWNAKLFRAIEFGEEENFKRKIVFKEENPSIYNDAFGSVIAMYDYGSPPNPYAPVTDVTNLQVVEGAYYLYKDGKVGSDINITWEAPADNTKRFLKEYIVELKKGSADYVEVGRPGDTKFTFYSVEDSVTYYVRIKTVSINDIISSGVVSSPLTVLGKMAPPSDVTGFGVAFATDHLEFSWNEVSDVDLWGYEIRELPYSGASWGIGTIIATKITGRSYSLLNLSTGTKYYAIKAIDTSENYSQNYAATSIGLTSIPDINVVAVFEDVLWGGTLSGDAEICWIKGYSQDYYRPAICFRSDVLWDVGNWDDGGFWDKDYDTQASATYITPVKDLGAVFDAGVTLELGIANVQGGNLQIEVAYSDTDSAPVNWTNFASGNFTGRYFRFRLTFSTSNASYGIDLYKFKAVFDVPDKTQEGSNVAVAGTGWTTINLTGFTNVAVVIVSCRGNAYIVETDESGLPSNFKVKLKDPASGMAQAAGAVNYYTKGY